MTFLEMCVELRALGGMQGTGPAAVTGQTGEYLRVVNWVKNAWLKIQLEREGKWRFLQSDFTKATVAGTTEYEFYTADGVKSFDTDSFHIYLDSEGVNTRQRLRFEDYRSFRNNYTDFSDTDRPYVVTVTPGYKLKVYPSPDAVYTITADAFDKPVTLAADSDTPALLDEYHQVIVFRALMAYAGYEQIPEVYQYAQTEYTNLYNRMLWDVLYEEDFQVVRVE